MAKTFEQWMADNGLSNGYGPGYVYSREGGSYNKADAIKNWQQENSQGMLADLLGGGSAGSANPYGTSAPTVNTSNRFDAGLSDAETRLRALLDNPDSIQQSAAYKFRVGQGQEALQRSLGAKGMLNSGNRLMELTKYGQDMGSQEYDAQAERLGSLLGTYGQGYVGDKNANTSLFSAQANAWNTAQANADRNRYQMGSLAWEMNKPQGGGGSSSSSRTNLSALGGSSNLGAIGGSTDAWSNYKPYVPSGSSADSSYEASTRAMNHFWTSGRKSATYDANGNPY